MPAVPSLEPLSGYAGAAVDACLFGSILCHPCCKPGGCWPAGVALQDGFPLLPCKGTPAVPLGGVVPLAPLVLLNSSKQCWKNDAFFLWSGVGGVKKKNHTLSLPRKSSCRGSDAERAGMQQCRWGLGEVPGQDGCHTLCMSVGWAGEVPHRNTHTNTCLSLHNKIQRGE